MFLQILPPYPSLNSDYTEEQITNQNAGFDKTKKASKYTDTLPSGDDIRRKAIASFDNVLSFANHLGIFSEEVAISGEAMGNVPQAFSHLSCISAAMNLPDSRR